MTEWKDNYKSSLGQFLIACSQWEYVYELTWKDLNPDPSASFPEKMKKADSQIRNGGKNLLKALGKVGSKECIEIVKLIELLEGRFRSQRDLMVHGFHHFYEGNCLVSRFSTNKEDIIGEELNPETLSDNSKQINKIVNEINVLRKKTFHRKP